jgi:hypothetical protein
MTNERGKSDRFTVPAKPSNKGSGAPTPNYGDPYTGTKAETPDTAKGPPTVRRTSKSLPAEGVEGKSLPKGNPRKQTMLRTQGRASMQHALERVRQAAVRDRKLQFTALLHHVYNPDTLREAYFGLKRDAAAGVDGKTWRGYGETLEDNLRDLSERLKRGAYRAKPVRRAFIPKSDGRQRPLGGVKILFAALGMPFLSGQS